MEMTIEKVGIYKGKKGNGLVLTYTKKDPDGSDVVVPGEIHKGIIHNDLQKALNRLGLHFAIMTGYVKANEVEDIAQPDPKLSERFYVKSYSIGGDEEKPGITISGHYLLPGNGKAVNTHTPFTLFDENPASRYAYMDDLQAAVRNIEAEIPLYLSGEKRGTPVQGELDLKDQPKKKDKGGKVTEEGNLAPASAKHKFADKDAMERVAAMDEEDGGKKTKKRQARKTDTDAVEEEVKENAE